MTFVLQLFRLLKIISVVYRFRLDHLVLEADHSGRLLLLWQIFFFWRRPHVPRGARLRQALEALGPIFVKFGQLLSTRRDLLPSDFADELAKLQDRVPPFALVQVQRTIERAYGCEMSTVFPSFDDVPVASASIAQVHFAVLPDGQSVAVKVLRPNMLSVIDHDIGLMRIAAWLLEMVWPASRRLRPREVVDEFARVLHDELDLLNEAANCAQLKRNFSRSSMLVIPNVFWEYCTSTVMVMERMVGTPISQIDVLREQGVDIPVLARVGVEIFFTQVFRDGFFHADMHPGNIFVLMDGRYVAVDFGVMGTLTDRDKNYLAQNFLAFFNRDYKRVAQAHVDAGWAPLDTRIDQFEAAIRAACEPFFGRPLREISFGKLLLRLFQTSRRFDVQIQPQLVLLQKTLLNIEGLGRQLDPDLDLWKTAKPYLERWMSEQLGWRALYRQLRDEAPYWANTLPQVPRLVHRVLIAADQNHDGTSATILALKTHQAKLTGMTRLLVAALAINSLMLMALFVLMTKT